MGRYSDYEAEQALGPAESALEIVQVKVQVWLTKEAARKSESYEAAYRVMEHNIRHQTGGTLPAGYRGAVKWTYSGRRRAYLGTLEMSAIKHTHQWVPLGEYGRNPAGSDWWVYRCRDYARCRGEKVND